MRNFSDLTEREVLALAIANEEEDSRIYADIAEGLRDDYPATAKVFTEMGAEEGEHRRRLIELYREKFGEHIPLIRRQDIRGFIQHKPIWQIRPLGLDAVRDLAESMEVETLRFYRRAASRSTDASIRSLLGDLAEAEVQHEHTAARLEAENLPTSVRQQEDAAAHRLFLLRVIQPGLAGLMDGSVSTLAPLFAAALATGHSWSRLRGGPGGLDRRRHLHGLRRGAVRQRQPDRPRRAVDPRRDLRADDHARRHRPYAAVPDPGILDRHVGRLRRGGRRTRRDQLGALEIHGYAPASQRRSR